ncbi:MAG: dihydrolipoyl dehydrogenase [marine bacterium B5-7]|nr:MAG: dihydrolipoyl dehydrogenase [marine bacterium B5-7]
MSNKQTIEVPDIGDFEAVEVIEVLVAPGDAVDTEDALITVESDKASMDIPAPTSGTVVEVLVTVGDSVSKGTQIVVLDMASTGTVGARDPQPTVQQPAASSAAPSDAGGGYGGSMVRDVTVPDIGDFEGVDVIELLVTPGDRVAVDDALITLESDKASMDVPAPFAGLVKSVKVTVGDSVSKGDLILTMEVEGGADAVTPTEGASDYAGNADVTADVVVLGSGPGGYSAAFRAADLGLKTILIERYETLGGVCLNVGCIPSKALLHAAKVIDEADSFATHGIKFSSPEVDIDALRDWKSGIVKRLTGGLAGLAKQRKVNVVNGVSRFLDAHHIEVLDGEGNATVVGFEKCIIAVGSEPVKLPFLPDDPRIVDSTGALELNGVPKSMLVIGGGIIGLEMATVYHALGTRVSVVEMLDSLVAGADKDIVRPLFKRLQQRYESILLNTRVSAVKSFDDGLEVTFEGDGAPAPMRFDRILVAVGRTPNGAQIDADKAGVQVDKRGFIAVDNHQRTNVANIFAIGDVVGQPMLAHKAVHEGKVAAEICAGLKSVFDARCIPSVAYTDPEIAWVGKTEDECKAAGIKYGKGVFPWAASGRSLALGREEGLTKLLFEADSGQVIGAGITGPNAGDLIAEVALAIEMGADATDIGLTIHPHPTLSETVAMAAEAFEGTITDLYMPKRK